MSRCEATGCNYAVDMRMKLQALIPAMEHAEEVDLGSEVLRGTLQTRRGDAVFAFF